MNKVLIINSHGLGDCLESLKCAHFVNQKLGYNSVNIISATRDEVFKPLKHLFGHLFYIEQEKDKEKWGDNHWI